MILAETESYLSRPIAPTRRIALGPGRLPVDPAPGYGGILLGGIVAHFARFLDDETREDISLLLDQLEAGQRVAQPRLRHRLQTDTVGLQRCRHRLVADGDRVELVFGEAAKGTPLQHVLCAAYATAELCERHPAVMATARKGLVWDGDDDRLITFLSGQRSDAGAGIVLDPVGWALDLLALRSVSATLHPATLSLPSRDDVQRAFREQLRAAHPDHGGERHLAADRISQLSEARRILLG